MKTAISALALATALFAGAANAADLPSAKAPPPYIPPPPVMSWNGFYAGLNIGGGFQDSSSSNVTLFGANNGGGAAGVVGGGQIGYNWQVTPMFVLGGEADFQGTSVGSGGGSNWWGAPAADRVSINWFGTVRGRLGVTLFNPNLLIYGTGGFAYGEVQRNWWGGGWWNNNSAVQTGWTAGGGAEWMFMPNWSVKVEYLYTEISGGNSNWLNAGVGLNNVNNRTRFHTVRAGVNYHFNLFNSAPVLAKY